MDLNRSTPDPRRRTGIKLEQQVAGAAPFARAIPKKEDRSGFYLVMAYLLFEFGRPQELIPGIRVIPFGTGLSVLIFIKVMMSGRLNFSPMQTRLWIALFPIMAIHVPIAVNNFWALMTFKDMFLLFFVYLGITVFVDSTERMMTMVKTWIGVHGFLAVMGTLKGGHGIGAWMDDENDFCMVMDMVVPFAYFLLFAVTGAAQKMRYMAFLGTFLLAAMATLSRGGFVGLASVGAYCWYRSPKKGNALIVLLIAIVFMVLFAPQTYWDEIASSTSNETMSEEGTGGARLYTWGIGMRMFYSNPIIGIGQSNFPWTLHIYEAGEKFHDRSFSGRQAHSAWVTLLSELGLAGVVIIGGMLACCFKDLKWVRKKFTPVESKKKHGQEMRTGEDIRMYLARAMEGSLIGYIVSSVFISTLWYPSMWIMMAFVVALRNIAEADGKEFGETAGRPTFPRRIALPRLKDQPIPIQIPASRHSAGSSSSQF
ncbi:MAG TPA: O-antigen ligase family protein [Nitrospira sp.]|nr:O-antigen ligase family protein [Nitrospira sp.]